MPLNQKLNLNLIIDTFSWKKFDLLEDSKLFRVSNLYNYANICITHEVLTEIKHFRLKSCDFKSTIILPILDENVYRDAINLDFDEADAQILSNGSNSGDTLIVSEDKLMLKFCQAYKFDVVQIADLFHFLAKINYIEYRDLRRIIRFLREKKNITEKKVKQIKKWLKNH